MATSNSKTPVSRVQAGDNKANATEAGAVAGGNGTGNALSDDTTTAGVLLVSAIRTGAISATGVAGTIGVSLQGLYGSLTINQDGTYVYVVDNNNAAVNALAKGKSLQESFTYTASNGSASAEAAIVVKVNGANDAATIAGLASGAVLEDGATAVASGKLTVTDVDLGENMVKTDNEQSGEYGKFSITSDGAWTYVLNKNSSDVQSLTAGETVTEKFVVTSKDGTATQNVIVTVTGTNDVARIEGDARGTLTEDAKNTVAHGELSIKDTDHGESAARVVTNQAGTYGAFSVDAKGGWTYVLNNSLAAVQALAQGEKGSDSFVVWSKDGSTSQTVTMTINGINDVATITGADTGAVNEDASPNTATGKLTVNDVDHGENTVVPIVNKIGSFGSFSIAIDGTWTYALNNSLATVQTLGAGVVRTETFTVYSKDSQLISLSGDDGDGDSDSDSGNEVDHNEDSGNNDHQTADYHGASKVITVTIIGTNDAAVITGSSTGAVTEDFSLAASGQLSAADLDTGEIGFRAQSATAGSYGGFSLDAGGHWTYGLNNAAAIVQALAANETATETFTVKSFDGTEKLVTVTVTGTNDAASISGTSTGSAAEDATLTSNGALTVSDVDHGQAVVQAQANAAGVYGSFNIALDGNWTYALSNTAANVQALAAGEQVTDSFTVLSKDGSASQIVSVALTGTNDAPTGAATAVLAAGTEDTAYTVSAANLLTGFSDVDTGDTLSVSGLTASSGSLIGNGDGTFTIMPTANFNGAVTLNYNIVDSQGASVAATQSYTLAAVNDAPVAVGDTNGSDTVIESNALNSYAGDPTAVGNVLANDTDVDIGDTKTVSAVNGVALSVGASIVGTYGAVTIASDGSYTYTLDNNNSATNALPQGAKVNDVFNYTMTDAAGATSTTTLSISITGTNDRPVAGYDQNYNDPVKEAGIGAGGVVVAGDATAVGNVLANDSDVDAGSVITLAQFLGSAANIGVPIQGTYGSIVLSSNGDYTYTLDNARAATNALAQGAIATDAFDMVLIADQFGLTFPSRLHMAISGTNDAPTGTATGTLAAGTEDTAYTVSAANLLAGFSDVDAGDTLSVSGLTASNGTITGNGTFTITPTANFNGAVTLNYNVIDSHGGSVAATQSYTLAAVNDAATISGVSTGAVTEDTTLATSGSLTVSDVDTGEAVFRVQTAAAGTYGSFSISTSGNWSYTLNNSAANVQALNTANHMSDSFTVLSQDGTASQVVTVSVNGMDEPQTNLVADFEGLASGSMILDGYSGFNWRVPGSYVSLYALNGDTYGASGYHVAAVDNGAMVAYTPGGAEPVTITRTNGGDFKFNSVELTAAWVNLNVTLTGYNNGIMVGTMPVNLSTTSESTVTSNWGYIDQLVIDVVGTVSQLVLDDFTYSL